MNVNFTESMWKEKPHIIHHAKKFAKRQSDYFNETGENIKDEISFDCLGQNIINPFYDGTMRFELTLEESYAYYGVAHMDYFVEEAYKKEVERVFYENYVNRYHNEQGYFTMQELCTNGRVCMTFMDTHIGHITYCLYVNLTNCGELQIWNDRNENTVTYAEECDLSDEDVDIIRFGYHPRKPLTTDELRALKFYHTRDLQYTNMDVFYENNKYTLEYYGKAKYGYDDEVLYESDNLEDIKKYLDRFFAGEC